MKMLDGFSKIESLDFQVQFVGASDFFLLYESMRQHPAVGHLIAYAAGKSEILQQIYNRLLQRLSEFDPEIQLFDDETFFAYLVCLAEVDIRLAHKAGFHVPKDQGLMWSRWLVLHSEERLQRMECSIHVSSSVSAYRVVTHDVNVPVVNSYSRAKQSNHVLSSRNVNSYYPAYPAALTLAS